MTTVKGQKSSWQGLMSSEGCVKGNPHHSVDRKRYLQGWLREIASYLGDQWSWTRWNIPHYPQGRWGTLVGGQGTGCFQLLHGCHPHARLHWACPTARLASRPNEGGTVDLIQIYMHKCSWLHTHCPVSLSHTSTTHTIIKHVAILYSSAS